MMNSSPRWFKLGRWQRTMTKGRCSNIGTGTIFLTLMAQYHCLRPDIYQFITLKSCWHFFLTEQPDAALERADYQMEEYVDSGSVDTWLEMMWCCFTFKDRIVRPHVEVPGRMKPKTEGGGRAGTIDGLWMCAVSLASAGHIQVCYLKKQDRCFFLTE